ncbi:hypothetical protein CI109_105054 [Kwoniella shandongensis]|uniref:Uncharacterized protein n=1 Tax=Kwoniella shandongensis TaxID=1734106 RepID=A0A5M6BWN0_9TREE|nr:uncharacterized protein CI109_004346 [Kwoniella shandongensis]KAA5527286.1 hypothetical protein CI109_004346 [Kwoniella shandongensis]
MSTTTEEVRIKRPRPTDIEERDPKRAKNSSESDVAPAKPVLEEGSTSAMTASASISSTPTKGQIWVREQLGKMEKLYKEVLIQAALIFQHQSFSERLGLKGQRVPVHMVHRLETSWRAYEGLRRQTEWCISQSGQQPLNKPTQPSTIDVNVTSPFSHDQAQKPIASPPKSIPLPIPSHLTANGRPPAVSSPIPLGAASLLAFDGQRLQAPPGNEPISLDAAQTLQQPPFQQTQPMQEQDILQDGSTTNTTATAGVDYASMGLDELTALINGDASSFDLNMGAQIQQQQQQQQQLQGGSQAQQQQQRPQTIDLTLDDNSNVNQSAATAGAISIENGQVAQSNNSASDEAILASLGLGTTQQQSQSQSQPQAPNQNLGGQNVSAQQAPAPTTMDFDFSAALPTGTTEPDFSALAGLFPSSDDVGQQATGSMSGSTTAQQPNLTAQETSKMDQSLESLMGGSGATSTDANMLGATLEAGNGSGSDALVINSGTDNTAIPARQESEIVPDVSNQDTMSNLIAELEANNGVVQQPSGGVGVGVGVGDLDASYGEMGGIDMSDFNFTDSGGMDGDEFERLMAEFQ